MIVAVDLLANALLICGANKDYSGRRKDLRYSENLVQGWAKRWASGCVNDADWARQKW